MARRRAQAKQRSNLSRPLQSAALESGLTPGQLARQAGIDRRAIARFLAGERDLTLASADALAIALGLRLNYAPGRRTVKPVGRPGEPPRTEPSE